MKLKRIGLGLVALASILLASSVPASAGGMWQNWPGIGYSSYCAAIVGSSNVQAGTTSQGAGAVGSNGVYCAQTVPAGPTTFAGTEIVPVDIGPLGAVSGTPTQSAMVSLLQLGQGPMVDVTTVGTSQTIPNATPWYFLDGAQGSALTVTMPASAIEGQIQHVVCEAATVGTLTVAANTNQTLKGNPNAACTAGVGYAWRYQASNTTWYRIQ